MLSTVLYRLGERLLILHMGKLAIACYEMAINIKPDNYQAWYSKARTLRAMLRFDKAIASYEKVVQIQPDYYQAWDELGTVLEKMNRDDEAIDCYQKAFEFKKLFQDAIEAA